jgi:hypothetical protein
MVGIVKDVGSGLVNWHGARAGSGVGGLAGVYGKRVKLLRIFVRHISLLLNLLMG